MEALIIIGLVLVLGFAGWEYRLQRRSRTDMDARASDHHVPTIPGDHARGDDQPLDHMDNLDHLGH